MQSKFIENIPVCVRIIIVFLMILTLFIAKSIFLILMITVLILIIIILMNKSVKIYIKMFIKLLLYLLFIVVAYIIISRNVNGILILIYKLALILCLIKCFVLSVNFSTLNNGIYSLLIPFNKFKIFRNSEKISFNITSCLYFIIYLFNSDETVIKFQDINNKRKYGIKNYFIPRLSIAIYQINKLQTNLELKFYKAKVEKLNFKSIILLLLFVILFATSIFKEVIL